MMMLDLPSTRDSMTPGVSSSRTDSSTRKETLDTSPLDQHLAPDDFYDRICLIRTKDDEIVVPVDCEVDAYRLWPALKYASHKELMEDIKTNVPSNAMKKFKGLLTVEYYRICRQRKERSGDVKIFGIAYLIGRKGGLHLEFLAKSDEGEIVTDNGHVFEFYDHIQEIEAGEGTHCGSEKFQSAVKLVMHRIEKTTAGMDQQSFASYSPSRAKLEVTAAAELTVVNMTKVGQSTSMKKQENNVAEMKTLKQEKNDPEMHAAKTTTTMPSSSPARGTILKTSKDDHFSAESVADAECGRPVKTVEFSGEGCSGSVSSPEKPSFPDDDEERSVALSEAFSSKYSSSSASVQKRIHRSSPAVERGMSWIDMHIQMKADGWTHFKGSDLVEWYYLHPTCKGMNKTNLLHNKKEGVDFFTSEADLKRYAKLHLGWREGCVSPVADSPSDAELADRVKKRKRKATLPAVKQAAAKSSSEMKNSDAKSAKEAKKQQARTTKTKDMAPKMTPRIPKSQGSVSSEEGSRFSHVSDSVRTASELEVNIGVKSAKKKNNAAKSLKFAAQNSCSSESCVESGSDANSMRGSTSGNSSAGSGSPSEQSSVNRTYQIMSSKSAWILLQNRFEFSYNGGKYCLPGKENRPGKESTATEGVNHFGSLDSLRKHLCAYGLPEVKKSLSDMETHDLQLWVRFAHVFNIGDAVLINPDDIGELLDFKQAWTMLQKLGLKFSSYCYLYPNSDPSNAPLRFEKAEDFSAHLARFGIPPVAGIEQHKVLDPDDRMRLDISIAYTDIDTFARINPNVENVYEITPRKRKCRTSATESTLVEPNGKKANVTKHTLKQRPFQMDFNQLEQQRNLPSQLISSKEALSILVDNYNAEVIKRGGVDHYCLPLTEGECSTQYFETLQDLRENLCAFGLPPMVKRSSLSEKKGLDLESWIRCANMEALRDPNAALPQDIVLRPRDASRILKGLGYNMHTYVLPGTLSHKSKLGYDRFEKLIDLINHLARFGLDDSWKPAEPKYSFSEEDRLQLEAFVASVATFDVRKRIDGSNHPIRKKRTLEDRESSLATDPSVAKAQSTAQKAVQFNAVAKVGVTATPSQPAVVDDEGDQDTPHPSPKKKPQANPITKFFSARPIVGDANGPTLSSNFHAPADQRCEYSPASTLDNLSPSCIDTKGDDDVEACFAGTPDCESSAPGNVNVTHTPEICFTTPKKKLETMVHGTPQEISMDVSCHPQAEGPNMPWKDLWAQMRKSGWGFCKGDDLISYYWLHPSVAGMKKTHIIEQCTEGIHYFTTEEAIHRYAKKRLGWAGEGVAPSPAALDISMTARVKKRRLDNMFKSEASTPPKMSASSPEGRNNDKVSSSTDMPPTKKSRTPPQNNEENCNASNSPSHSPGHSVNSQSIGDKEYKSPPDLQLNVRDKLEYCQMVLHPSFNKKQLSKSSSMSVVSSMEHDIKEFMEKSILTGAIMDGITLPSPGFLYVCGGPGTGKTTAVTSCAEEMTKWAKANGYEKPLVCSVNMAASQTSSNSKVGVMRTMLKKIATGLSIANDDPLVKFESLMMKRVVVLIVDELDMLFKQHGGIGETWFKTLVSWAEDREMRFSMIGISNCVNDVDSSRVRELGHSPPELVFPTYKEDDIRAILEQRLGKHVVDHKALQLISRRVAASSGDARRALEITSNAVGKCLDLLKPEELDAKMKYNDERMPLVKLPHMMRAIREAMPMRHADVISGLPQAAKVVLCIAVSLGQAWGPTAEISISTLKKFCVEATRHAVMDELGPGHVLNLVDMLIDSGLLVTDNSSHHYNPNDANPKLKIGVQLDDVEIALEESLLNEGGFYRSLVDYVKRERPRPSSP